jgi:S-adenosylmethionine synthetase
MDVCAWPAKPSPPPTAWSSPERSACRLPWSRKTRTATTPSIRRKFRSAARRAIKSIGYEQDGFHWKTCKIDVLLHFQSADIAQGVDNAADRQGEEGAGDQGIMFGYACRETPELMPAPIYYSHKILELMAEARHKGEGDAGKLGPDAKSQVTVRYENGKPSEVTSIVLSTQHLDESVGFGQGAFESSSPMFARHFPA